jgi:hypothetical protein
MLDYTIGYLSAMIDKKKLTKRKLLSDLHYLYFKLTRNTPHAVKAEIKLAERGYPVMTWLRNLKAEETAKKDFIDDRKPLPIIWYG